MSALWYVLLFFVGASVGSFLNVCITRWPKGESVIRPRSRCPACQAPIAWYDNVPVVSWLALRARCRRCGAPISLLYPVVEALIGAVWVASVWAFGPTVAAIRVAVFFTVLFGIAATDLRAYVIPDGFTLFGLAFVGLASVVGALTGAQYPFAPPVEALLGACVGAGAITIIGWLGEVAFRKEAMGFGDATLMAMAGAALGPGRALLTILVAAALGAAVFLFGVIPIGWMRARQRGVAFETPLVPFGVFLAPAAMLTLLWGYPILSWYLDRLAG